MKESMSVSNRVYNCPICYNILRYECYSRVDGKVAEETKSCPEGHFDYRYYYGYIEYYIGDKRFHWKYDDDELLKRKRNILAWEEVRRLREQSGGG